MRHDSLTTGWQIFLFNVTVDPRENLLYFGLAVIDPGISNSKVKLYDPDRPAAVYFLDLPPEYLNSNSTIVHLRKSIAYHGQKTIQAAKHAISEHPIQ